MEKCVMLLSMQQSLQSRMTEGPELFFTILTWCIKTTTLEVSITKTTKNIKEYIWPTKECFFNFILTAISIFGRTQKSR